MELTQGEYPEGHLPERCSLTIMILIAIMQYLSSAIEATHFLNPKKKIHHLIYMDDIKLFAKNNKEFETLIQTIRIYSQDIGMGFGEEKSAICITR